MEITHLQVYYYFADSDFLGSKLAAKLASTSSLQEKQKFFLQTNSLTLNTKPIN